MRKKAPVSSRNSGTTKNIVEILRILRKSLRSHLCHQGQENGLTGTVSPYAAVNSLDPAQEVENKVVKMSENFYAPSIASSSSTLNSGSSSVVLGKAPGSACFNFFLDQYMRVEENEYTVRTQLRQIISDKDTQYLPNIHPHEGRALEEEAVRLIFRLCEKFNVGNLVKFHSLHIYDRWVISMDDEVNNLRPMTIGVANQVELKIEDKALLGMAVCIQLASKNVGRISAVSPNRVMKVLGKFGIDVDTDEVRKMELVVFQALGYRLAVLTPLEVVDHILALIGLKEEDYRFMYGICVSVLNLFYLKRDFIFTQLLRLFGTNILPPQLRNDYVFHGAAVVQTASSIRFPLFPKALLPKLQSLANINQVDIYRLSQAIYLALDSIH